MRFPLAASWAIALLATPVVASAQDDNPAPCLSATLDEWTLARFVPPQVDRNAAPQVRALVRRSLTWTPGQSIKVCFKSGSETAQERVARYAREWTEHANLVLDFGPPGRLHRCQDDGSEDIKIDFQDGKGSWSALGILARRRNPSMNLEFLGVDDPVSRTGKRISEAHIRRVVLHEFGHALGLLHEHQSPNAACDAEFDWDKAYELGARWGWDKQKVDRWFRQVAHSDEINMSEVDRKSIMHYALPPEVFKLGKESRCWIPYNFELSQQDRAFVRMIYPRTEEVASDGPREARVRSARAPASREAAVREYERLLQAAGLAAEESAELAGELRRLVLKR
jgi:hypothetical protein